MTSPYLTSLEAAALLRFSKRTLEELVRRGELLRGVHFFDIVPSYRSPSKFGRRNRRWKREALIAWVEGRPAEEDGEDDVIPLRGVR